MKVKFTSALFDSSGYAEASRNYVRALMTQPDIELSLNVVSFENWKTEMDSFKQQVEHLLSNKEDSVDIHIIHLTPENFPRFKKIGKKTIGLTVWETNRLPSDWVALCNQLDEIWVPAKFNVDIFINSGVTVPVKYAPHCVDLSEYENITPEKTIVECPQLIERKDSFKFYSIFQWSARKNPDGLIKSYISEFNSNDNVCLILKTYCVNNRQEDKLKVIEFIQRIKADMQLKETPPIVLLHGGFSRMEILNLHKIGDCFVLPHRCEGWGVPHFEAMASGNPAIATGYGGNTEFMSAENSWLLPYFMTPVTQMGRPTYNGKMQWAEPSLQHCQESMCEAYTNKVMLKIKGLAAKESVKKFTIQEVSSILLSLLKDGK